MNRLAALAAFLYLGVASAAPPSKDEIHSLLQELGGITGMMPKRDVPVAIMTREEWKQWLEREIAERVKPEEIRAEELAIKKLGLAPPEFDLKKTTLDLLTEQAAAFYEHRRKRMVFVEGAPAGMDQMVLVHELGHALADQHFKLGRFLDSDSTTDDAALARLATVEGQAMYLMMELPMRRSGTSLADRKGALEILAGATSSMAEGMFPVFDKSPLYLRETLLFPYKEGVLFQQAVVERLGKDAFAEVLRRPPSSTQQIIHPEKYLDRIEPAAVRLPELSAAAGYKQIIEGTLGEVDFRVLIQQFGNLEDARRIAALWRGGRFDLQERKKDGGLLLRLASEWESPQAARDFARAYRKVLAGKWKKYAPAKDSEALVYGAGDDGRFYLRLEGTRVESVEGMERDEDAKRPAL